MRFSKNYADKDWEVIRPYLWCINRALWNEVIPSLRKVIMEWDNHENTICVYFYHDGVITQAVEKHYAHIYRLAHFQGLEMEVNFNYKIIRLDYPDCTPKREFVIYVRKEPFIDPVNDSPLPSVGTPFYWESYKRDKPLTHEIAYDKNDWEIIRDFRWYVSRALWGEVIPSLRQVCIQWDPEEKIIWILFHHDGPITGAMVEHYGFIDSLADCDASKGVQTCFRIIRLDYPKSVPSDSFIVYARKEPFIDP